MKIDSLAATSLLCLWASWMMNPIFALEEVEEDNASWCDNDETPIHFKASKFHEELCCDDAEVPTFCQIAGTSTNVPVDAELEEQLMVEVIMSSIFQELNIDHDEENRKLYDDDYADDYAEEDDEYYDEEEIDSEEEERILNEQIQQAVQEQIDEIVKKMVDKMVKKKLAKKGITPKTTTGSGGYGGYGGGAYGGGGYYGPSIAGGCPCNPCAACSPCGCP